MSVNELKILLDENVPVSIKEKLTRLGYKDIVTIGERCCGIPDRDVIMLAQSEKRMLITQDNDFKKLKEFNDYGILQFSSEISSAELAIDFGIKRAFQFKSNAKGMYIRISNKECYCEYPKNKYKDEGKQIKRFKLEF